MMVYTTKNPFYTFEIGFYSSSIYSSTMDLHFYSSISSCPFPIKCLTSILESSKITLLTFIYFFEAQRINLFCPSPLMVKVATRKQHQSLRLLKQSYISAK